MSITTSSNKKIDEMHHFLFTILIYMINNLTGK